MHAESTNAKTLIYKLTQNIPLCTCTTYIVYERVLSGIRVHFQDDLNNQLDVDLQRKSDKF